MSKATVPDLGLHSDNRKNHPWDYPNCPDCGRHIYVDRAGNNTVEFDFVCHKCGYFQTPPNYALREELQQ